MKKILSVVASLAILANSLLYPFAYAYAQEETSTPEPTPIVEEIEEIVTPSPEPTVTPELTPTPTQSPSPWTFEKVELNKEYIAPQNSEVKLTFTKLPDPSGSIKIEEITLTEDQIKQTGSLSDKAYDITSDMENGSFTYNLSLPIPEASKGKTVEVKFAEEISKIASAEKVDNTLTKTDTSVSVTSLDHFTIFVVTKDLTPLSGGACTSAGADGESNCFNTIQDAIDAAPSGATINVAAGTYVETVLISGKTNLTIQGVGDTTLVEPTPAYRAHGFAITNSNNITIKNLKIHTNAEEAHGIWVYGAALGGNSMIGLTVQDTTIVADGGVSGIIGDSSSNAVHSGWLIGGVGHGNTITAGGDGIDLQDVTDSEVSYNTITIPYLTGGTNVLWTSERFNLANLKFNNNTISGSGGSEVSILTDFNQFGSNVPVENPVVNTLINGVTFSGNTFSNWGSRAIRVGNAAGTGTVTGITINSNTFQMTADTAQVIGGTATDKTGTGNTFNVNSPAKIQKAIDNAFSGDTISVAAGTYNENQIIIDKPLTLQGAGYETTIIDGGGTSTGGLVKITANSGTVILSGFTIQNTNNSDDLGHGINVDNGGVSSVDVKILNNAVKNVGPVGIRVNDANSIQIEGNTISSLYSSTAVIPNGIQVGWPNGSGVTGTIKSNEISGSSWVDYNASLGYEGSTTGAGILIIDATADLEISSNDIYDNNVGIDIEAGSSTTIENNDIHDNAYGVVLYNANPKINTNKIESNNTSGVFRTSYGDTSGTVDATENWWGSIVETDIQSKISGEVDYDPWYLDSGKTTLSDTINTVFDDVSDSLADQGIESNIGNVTASNFTSFPNLYFEKSVDINGTLTKVGKITFTASLDLSSEATQEFLQNLGSEMEQSNGRIALDVQTSTEFTNKGAVLVMYGIMSAVDVTKIVARDESNNILSGLVSGFSQTGSTVSFTAAHFTQFDIDTTAPEIADHYSITAEATSASGATLTYTAPDATDNIDPTTSANCLPVSGSIFAMGNTTVTCNKTDTAGNAATPTTFMVNVHDTTNPVIADRGTETAEATSPSGAVVTYTAPNATDNIDATAPASCSPISGSTFTLGNTTVTCTKTDTAGNSAAPKSFTVTVQDTTKPEDVTVSDSGTFTNNPHLTFTWPASTDLVSGISYYEFWLSTAKNESNALDLDTGSSNKWRNVGNVTSYTLADTEAALLSTGTQYFSKVKAVDNASNIAITGSFSWSDGITLDTTSPVISFVDRTAPNANGWNNSNVTVNWSCSDSGSGVVSAMVSQTVTSEGANQSSTGTCTDNADNTASNTQTGINIDKTAPTLNTISISSNNATSSLAKVGDIVTLHFFSNEPVKPPTIYIAGHQISEADITNNVSGGNGNEWFAHYQMAGGDSEGQVSFSIAYVDAVDNAGSTVTAITNGSNVVFDKTAPTVTKLGDGSEDYVLSVGDTSLVFSEVLSDSSKTAVQNALSDGANKTLTYVWSGATLTITASETTTFANDVTVTVIDLVGNTTNSLLIVDSKLGNTQTTPDSEGDATADSETPEVVITDPDQEVTVTVTGSTEATIDVSSFITDGQGDIPQININSTTADIEIPATTVTGPAGWNGVIAAPTVTTIDLPVISGETSTLGTAIEIGFATDKLSFDNAVRILLPGQAGKKAGYSRPGTDFTEITNICSSDSQAAGDALGVDGDCKIDVGLNLVIWTKHFTKFASYTQTTNSSSGGGGTTTAGAPVCNDTKPGSAPSGLTAVAGFNSVTLTWNKASDPVSYYLITYGTSSGSQTYGNPNIGGASTTSYTITNLSGGIKYYFKVRAGNGCAPGDYSNEASTTPSGGFVEGVAPGFEAGVLGESTEQDLDSTSTATAKPTSTPEVKGTKTSDWNARNIALISFGSALAILALLLLWRKKKK